MWPCHTACVSHLPGIVSVTHATLLYVGPSIKARVCVYRQQSEDSRERQFLNGPK